MNADRNCEHCAGVGHRKVTPEQAGWTRLADGWWQLPDYTRHRFSQPADEYLFRPCVCTEVVSEARRVGA